MGTELVIEGVDVSLPDVTIERIPVRKVGVEKELERIKEQLLIFAATAPRDVVTHMSPETSRHYGGSNVVPWEEYVQDKISELLDDYYSAVVEEYVLNLAEENKECLKNSF